MAPLAQPAAPLPPSEPQPTTQCTTSGAPIVPDGPANRFIAVENVSLDEDSLDGLMSLASESSAGSHDDELKAILDDHESGTRGLTNSLQLNPGHQTTISAVWMRSTTWTNLHFLTALLWIYHALRPQLISATFHILISILQHTQRRNRTRRVLQRIFPRVIRWFT